MFLYILNSMISCRLIATLTGGLLSHLRLIKSFQFDGQTHMVKFSKKMCVLDITSSLVAYTLVLSAISYGPISYLYDVLPTIFPIKAIVLLIVAQFIEQLIIFAFERIFNLHIVNKKLVSSILIKPHIKRCLINFNKGFIYDFVFYLVIAVSYVVFSGGTLYLLVLGVLMMIRSFWLTPPKLLL